jgi:hypothetical protein
MGRDLINLSRIFMVVGDFGEEIELSKADTKRVLSDMENGKWTYLEDPISTEPYPSEYMTFEDSERTTSYDQGKTWYGKRREPMVTPETYRYLDGELEGKYIRYDGRVYKIPYIKSQRGW